MPQLKIDLVVDDKGSLVLTGFGDKVDSVAFSGRAALKQLGSELAVAGAGFSALVATGGALLGQIVGITDRYALLDNKLALVTGSSEELAAIQHQLYQLTLDTHGTYEDTVTMFTRFARATADAGVSQGDLLTVTRSVNEAIIVSGATQAEATAAIIQLSQGMASGVLRGEELNSVLEQTPRVAKMIADGLGLTIGQLREYGKEGKLTTEAVIGALKSQAGTVHDEFGKMQVTVGQAWTDLKTVFQSIIADGGESAAVTSTLAGYIQDFGDYLNSHRDELSGYFADAMEAAKVFADEVIRIGRDGKPYLDGILDAVGGIYAGAKALGDLGGPSVGEWGIIGYALLRGGPKAAALATALITINNALDKFNLGLGDIKRSANEMQEPLANMWDVLSGKRDWNTGALTSAHDGLMAVHGAGGLAHDSLMTVHGAVEDVDEIAEELGETVEESGERQDEAHKRTVEEVQKLKDAYVKAADGITDNWALMYRDRYEIQSRALDRLVEKEEEETAEMEAAVDEFYGAIYDGNEGTETDTKDAAEYIKERWKEAYDGMQDTLAEWIKTGEISFDSLLELFKNMLAEMAAAWLMNLGKFAIMDLFGIGAGGNLAGFLGGLGNLPGAGSAASSAASWLGGLLGIGGAAGVPTLLGTGAAGAGLYPAVAVPVSGTGYAIGMGGAAATGGGSAAATGGGSAAATGGGIGMGSAAALGILGAAALGTLYFGFMKEKKPTTTDLWNQMGLRPEDFVQFAGDSFVEAVDPAWGGLMNYMSTASGDAVSTWDKFRQGFGATQTRIFNETTGQWEGLRYTVGATVAMMRGDVISEMDAMVMEANYGIDGLAEHLITASETALSTGDKIRNEFEEMGLSGGTLKRAMDLAQRAMDSASGETDDLERYLRDLGYTADDISGAIDTLDSRFDSLDGAISAVGTEMGNFNLNQVPTFLSNIDAIAGAVENASERISTAEDLIDQMGPPAPGIPSPTPTPPPGGGGGGTTVGGTTMVFNLHVDGKKVASTQSFISAMFKIADNNRVLAHKRGTPGRPLVLA